MHGLSSRRIAFISLQHVIVIGSAPTALPSRLAGLHSLSILPSKPPFIFDRHIASRHTSRVLNRSSPVRPSVTNQRSFKTLGQHRRFATKRVGQPQPSSLASAKTPTQYHAGLRRGPSPLQNSGSTEYRQRQNEKDGEHWRQQKAALRRKFADHGWQPRKRLSPDALEGIRALNAQQPDVYTTDVLAREFEVSPEAIRRILKSNWRPNGQESENRQRRWERRGAGIWAARAVVGAKPPAPWRHLINDGIRDSGSSWHDDLLDSPAARSIIHRDVERRKKLLEEKNKLVDEARRREAWEKRMLESEAKKLQAQRDQEKDSEQLLDDATQHPQSRDGNSVEKSVKAR